MKSFGLRAKLILVAVLPLAATVVVLSLHFTAARIDDLAEATESRGQALARQLVPAAEYGLYSGSRRVLQGVADSGLQAPEVISVSIEDRDGVPLVSARRQSADQPGLRFRAPVSSTPIVIDDYGGRVPVAAEPQRLGWVSVAVSNSGENARQNAIVAEGLGIASFGILIAALLAWQIAVRLSRPVLRLHTAVDRLGRGDLWVRVPESSSGELGLLETGLNRMAQALEQAQERERRQLTDELDRERVRAQVTLESIGDGVITTDDEGRVVYMNAVAERLTGWKLRACRGRDIWRTFRLSDAETGEPEHYPLELCLRDGAVVRHERGYILEHRDGTRFAIQDSAAPIRDRGKAIIGAVVVFHDITEFEQVTRRLEYLASHDILTGLPNRIRFEQALEALIESAGDGRDQHAICYLDLDQFKIVNDTCGHAAGDELLKQLTGLLRKELRPENMLARLGGDEFGVLLKDCPLDKAQRVAEQLRRAVKGFRFVSSDRAFEVGVSIGLVPVGRHSTSLADVLSAADTACYVAKDRGRNCIHTYQPGDVAIAERHREMDWVHRLQRSLEAGSFELVCQRITHLSDPEPGAPVFREILVRLKAGDGASVLPGLFIPAAERYQMMPLLDRWVVDSVFRMLQEYSGPDYRDGEALYAINLSGQSLCDMSFLDFVLARFERYGVNPRHVCFEITETAAIAHLGHARSFIQTLKRMGCRFALDDFGSGLSSFGYLKNLPVDYIKIAGDLVLGVVDDPVQRAMISAIQSIGCVMGLSIIAESVENAAIADCLRDIGVCYGQGLGLDDILPLRGVLAEQAISRSSLPR